MKVNLTQNITTEQFRTLERVMKNPFEFSRFVYVVHPTRGKVLFDLYPYQKAVLYQFLTKRFNQILKFRQAGITELFSLFVLWFCMYHSNKTVVIVSIKDRVAKRVLKRIKFMYKNLPGYLKTPVVNSRTSQDVGTAQEIEFSNGSMIISVPTTEDSGRSEALSGLVIDEAAVVRWASKIWASSFPTLSTGGWGIINSCVTGETRIIGKNDTFRIDSVCPKHFGVKDISKENIYVLSHTGEWRRVLKSVNKGILETWEIVSDAGDILRCTPDHKLLTTNGWFSVRDIISRGLYVITYDTGPNTIEEPPVTKPPSIEILKPVRGFPNYAISNLGKVFITRGKKIIEKRGSVNRWGYNSVSLWNNNQKKKCTVSRLVAETFIGDIPPGYIVDHINCNPSDNYCTNLQIITISENTIRSSGYSRNMVLGNKIGKGFANLYLIANVRLSYLEGKSVKEISDKYEIPASYVSRTLNNTRVSGVQVSKLKIVRKYLDTIYDISVDGDQSYITDSKYINHNTPMGVGNWYHSSWVDALHGSPINPIRLKWDMHPERGQAWYDEMRAVLGPRRTAQEIDGDFLSSGNTVFDLVDIKEIEDLLPDYPILDKRLGGNLLVFEDPVPGKHYFIGADVATGRSKDYSAFSLVDEWGTDCVVFKSRVPTDVFAKLLAHYGKEYNWAEVAPEANEIGEAVVKLLQEWCYPNIYHRIHFTKKKDETEPTQENVPGWLTTPKNRSIIINLLEEDIRRETITIKDPFFVAEGYTFIYDEANKPVAMGKRTSKDGAEDLMSDETYSDDAILAKSIANYIRKGKYRNIITAPV